MQSILVVEDDENLNRGITFSLKKSGYEVFCEHRQRVRGAEKGAGRAQGAPDPLKPRGAGARGADCQGRGKGIGFQSVEN